MTAYGHVAEMTGVGKELVTTDPVEAARDAAFAIIRFSAGTRL